MFNLFAISKKQQSPSELWLLKYLPTKASKLDVHLTQLCTYPSKTNDHESLIGIPTVPLPKTAANNLVAEFQQIADQRFWTLNAHFLFLVCVCFVWCLL